MSMSDYAMLALGRVHCWPIIIAQDGKQVQALLQGLVEGRSFQFRGKEADNF